MIFSRRFILLAAIAALSSCAPPQPEVPSETPLNTSGFAAFYLSLRQQVAAQGLDPTLLDAAFHLQSGQTPPAPAAAKAILGQEKAQPEAVSSFAGYTSKLLSATRIAKGRQLMAQYHTQLQQVETQTGVPASVIVALWAIETNFGGSVGTQPVIPALVTLAWRSSSRPEFYQKELFAALKVVGQNHLDPAELRGSWAGAFGQCQFMPSTYLAYAQDGDGDGLADIWHNPADVFASAGNYVKALGWHAGQPWYVSLHHQQPDLSGLDVNARGLSNPQTFTEWQQRGVTLPLPDGWFNSTKAHYFKPVDGSQPAMLLGPNFDVILGWNKSSFFAWSVLTLADRLQTGAPASPATTDNNNE